MAHGQIANTSPRQLLPPVNHDGLSSNKLFYSFITMVYPPNVDKFERIASALRNRETVIATSSTASFILLVTGRKVSRISLTSGKIFRVCISLHMFFRCVPANYDSDSNSRPTILPGLADSTRLRSPLLALGGPGSAVKAVSFYNIRHLLTDF